MVYLKITQLKGKSSSTPTCLGSLLFQGAGKYTGLVPWESAIGKHHPGDDLRDVFELADADDNGKISPQDSSDIFVDRCGGFVQKIFNTVLSVD